MRDYIVEQANFRSRTYAFSWLRRVIRNWLSRRYLRKLEQFDDYLLSDIGLTRDDLRYGQSLPHDVDPIAELTQQRQRRSPRGTRHR